MRPRDLTLLCFLAFATAGSALAQHDGHSPREDHHSPYAGQEATGIAALSSGELEDLEQGAGMGLARPAELHHYPGPKHVLELASELGLNDGQREKVQEARRRMLEEAQALGREIIEQERHLDRRFTHRHIDETTLEEVVRAIAVLYGELRFAHLRAHLETREILSATQIAAYDRLRGYHGPGAP